MEGCRPGEHQFGSGAFCTQCGQQRCVCGHVPGRKDKFCSKCGNQLQGGLPSGGAGGAPVGGQPAFGQEQGGHSCLGAPFGGPPVAQPPVGGQPTFGPQVVEHSGFGPSGGGNSGFGQPVSGEPHFGPLRDHSGSGAQSFAHHGYPPAPRPHMPACDVYIPDPCDEEGVTDEQRDEYGRFVAAVEDILGMNNLTVLSSRHPDFPLFGARFQLVHAAIQASRHVLYPLLLALAGRTMENIFSSCRHKTIFLQVHGRHDPRFRHIAERNHLVQCTNEKEIHEFAHRLAAQLQRQRVAAEPPPPPTPAPTPIPAPQAIAADHPHSNAPSSVSSAPLRCPNPGPKPEFAVPKQPPPPIRPKPGRQSTRELRDQPESKNSRSTRGSPVPIHSSSGAGHPAREKDVQGELTHPRHSSRTSSRRSDRTSRASAPSTSTSRATSPSTSTSRASSPSTLTSRASSPSTSISTAHAPRERRDSIGSECTAVGESDEYTSGGMTIENPSSDTTKDHSEPTGGESASDCTGLQVPKRYPSFHGGSDRTRDGEVMSVDGTDGEHFVPFGAPVTQINRSLQLQGSTADPKEVEQKAKAIAGCRDREGMAKIIEQRYEMVSCNVVPHAAENNNLTVLANLLVFSDNEALQLTAAYALRDTLVKILHRGSRHLDNILDMEQSLRCGLSSRIPENFALLRLFTEIYKLTVVAIRIAYALRPECEGRRSNAQFSKDSLIAALLPALENCRQNHGSLTEHVDFHLGTTLDLLKADNWAFEKTHPVHLILEKMEFCSQARQSPGDRDRSAKAILKAMEDRKITEPERCLLLHYFASALHTNSLQFKVYHDIFTKEIEVAERKRSKKLLFSCALLCVEMCSFISIPDNIAIMVEKNPFSRLVKACKKIERTATHYVHQLLSPVLYHTNDSLRKAIEHIFQDQDGEFLPGSTASMLEYQRQQLEKRLSCHGILLLHHDTCKDGDRLVTFRGELHGRRGVQRVTCRAYVPTTSRVTQPHADDPLSQNINVLVRLTQSPTPHPTYPHAPHFPQLLAYDNTSREKFYVTDQDYNLPSLSTVLLDDLVQSEPKILLRQQKEIIEGILLAALFAHGKEILLRSLCADAFRVEERGGQRRVIFWDLEHARHGTVDTYSHLVFHHVDDSEDGPPVLWMAPESIFEGRFDVRSEGYSLAKLIHEILSHGIHPHTGHSDMDTASIVRQIIKYKSMPERRLGMPTDLYLVILQYMLFDPSKRPTIDDLYETVRREGNREEQTYPAVTLQYLRTLRVKQISKPGIHRKLPEEFKHSTKMSDIWKDEGRVEKRYSKAICETFTPSQCDASEIYADDDPEPLGAGFGMWGCRIKKQTVDKKEQTMIINLNHPGIPKDLRFSQVRDQSGSPMLQMFVEPESKDLLSYFLQNPPDLQQRLEFYLQIADILKHLHSNGLVLCYLNPMFIRVGTGERGKQCVIIHLSRLTRLVKRKDELVEDAIVRPFPTIWPMNAARWSPLECNESGCFSIPSDIAMLSFVILQLESAIGRGRDVPIKDTVPYAFLAKEDVVEAQRCMQNPPQSRNTPHWLYRLLTASIVNEHFRRPSLDQYIQALTNRCFPSPKEKRIDGRNLRKRVSSLLDENSESMITGSIEHQQFKRRTFQAPPQPDPEPKQGQTKDKPKTKSVFGNFNLLRRPRGSEDTQKGGRGTRDGEMTDRRTRETDPIYHSLPEEQRPRPRTASGVQLGTGYSASTRSSQSTWSCDDRDGMSEYLEANRERNQPHTYGNVSLAQELCDHRNTSYADMNGPPGYRAPSPPRNAHIMPTTEETRDVEMDVGYVQEDPISPLTQNRKFSTDSLVRKWNTSTSSKDRGGSTQDPASRREYVDEISAALQNTSIPQNVMSPALTHSAQDDSRRYIAMSCQREEYLTPLSAPRTSMPVSKAELDQIRGRKTLQKPNFQPPPVPSANPSSDTTALSQSRTALPTDNAATHSSPRPQLPKPSEPRSQQAPGERTRMEQQAALNAEMSRPQSAQLPGLPSSEPRPRPHPQPHHQQRLITPDERKQMERQSMHIGQSSFPVVTQVDSYTYINNDPTVMQRRATDNRGRLSSAQIYGIYDEPDDIDQEPSSGIVPPDQPQEDGENENEMHSGAGSIGRVYDDGLYENEIYSAAGSIGNSKESKAEADDSAYENEFDSGAGSVGNPKETEEHGYDGYEPVQ